MPIPAITLDAPNGDKFMIRPFTTGLRELVLDELHGQGIELVPAKLGAREVLKFNQAVARNVLADWKRNDGGVMNDTTAKERVALINDRPKVTAWIYAKSEELANTGDKEFEVDAGN